MARLPRAAGCGWAVYRLGAEWFGWPAGALAAAILITRVPVLSYGVRAYVDVPYLLLVLSALLVESRTLRRDGRPAGAPVFALLALAGLLRPEAWAFSGIYWLYLIDIPARQIRARVPALARWLPSAGQRQRTPPSARELAALTLLAAAAPLVWIASDLAITGDPLWSLSNTRRTAETLDRMSGIANVPEYIPRRIGEILRPPVLAGAAIGGVLSLVWLRRRALLGASAGVIAVVVFAAFATAGLPIDTRYAFLAAAILAIFCGAGAFGWMLLARDHPYRRAWMVAGGLVLVALIAYAPAQYRSAHHELDALANQERIQNDLLALVDDRAIAVRCGPIGVPNHAPVPLLALYLKTSPRNIVSPEAGHISSGIYVDPASSEVETDYVLDRHDPVEPVSVPRGFYQTHADRSWRIFERCP